MSNFNDIKQQWAARHIPIASDQEYKAILDKTKHMEAKQKTGQIVLTITVVVLVLFFFYTTAYKNTTLFLGLGIMIVSLLLRISIEFFSSIKKAFLPADQDVKTFKKELLRFYNRRKVIHYVITPLLFTSYIFGFLLLLPSFKKTFSSGFYTYIVLSSFFVFIALALLIGVQIRKELASLKTLKEGMREEI